MDGGFGDGKRAVRQDIASLGVEGVFSILDGFDPPSAKPIVFVCTATDPDSLRDIRRNVWSHGVAPFLLAVTDETVEVCDGFRPPSAQPLSLACSLDGPLPEELSSFTASRICASVTWKDFELHRDKGVDNSLIRAIDALNKTARGEFGQLADRVDLVNLLIGKLIYAYVLVDRGIVSKSWLIERLKSKSPPDGTGFAERLFVETSRSRDVEAWSAAEMFAVFDELDGAINGSIFPFCPDRRRLVPDQLCHLIHRVVRKGAVLEESGEQLGFFDVSFAALRTETISAMYERFVSVENVDAKKDDGVFYTPPHLADHVLDRVEAMCPITAGARVVDPACGSGIFLVGAFRRLMEATVPRDGWSSRDISLAKKLLLGSIHGIEKNAQAASVCRFSLYLTLLEYVGDAPIDELVAIAGSEKFLPDLTANIRCANAFTPGASDGGFTHVIGNPPWSAAGGQRNRTNPGASASRQRSPEAMAFGKVVGAEGYPFAHDRLSDLFMWLAVTRLSRPGGVIAFLLPTKSLVGRHSSRFAHAVGQRTTVAWIGNLSHLRRKLFVGAEAPACLVVSLNREPNSADKVAVYRPLLTGLPGGRRGEIWALLASATDVDHQRSIDLRKGSNGWLPQA